MQSILWLHRTAHTDLFDLKKRKKKEEALDLAVTVVRDLAMGHESAAYAPVALCVCGTGLAQSSTLVTNGPAP